MHFFGPRTAEQAAARRSWCSDGFGEDIEVNGSPSLYGVTLGGFRDDIAVKQSVDLTLACSFKSKLRSCLKVT